MIVVSSKEFTTHQRKYYGLAMHDELCITRGRNRFRLVPEPADGVIYHEPDEDFYRSISIDELRERVKKNVHQWYKERDGSNSITGG